MPRVNIDTEFMMDGRPMLLAQLLNEHILMVRGRMLTLWAHCYQKRMSELCTRDLELQAMWTGTPGLLAESLVRAGLAEQLSPDLFKIKGVEERIAYLKEQSERGRLGGKVSKRLASAKQVLSEPQANAKQVPSVCKASLSSSVSKSNSNSFKGREISDSSPAAPPLKKQNKITAQEISKERADRTRARAVVQNWAAAVRRNPSSEDEAKALMTPEEWTLLVRRFSSYIAFAKEYCANVRDGYSARFEVHVSDWVLDQQLRAAVMSMPKAAAKRANIAQALKADHPPDEG